MKKKLFSLLVVACASYCWGHWQGYNKATAYQKEIQQQREQIKLISRLGKR